MHNKSPAAPKRGAGNERRWQRMKRIGGSVNKGVCQAAAKADDHCEQRKVVRSAGSDAIPRRNINISTSSVRHWIYGVLLLGWQSDV